MVSKTPSTEVETAPIITSPYVRYSLAKAAFPVFTKDKAGHGYKYVPLEDIQRAINPVLGAHGLILVDELRERGGGYGLYTTLRDQQTGSLIAASFFMFNVAPQYGTDKRGNPTLSYGTAQDVGGWRTYAARYNRATLLDLVLVGEDDDAASLNRADGTTTRAASPAITERSTKTDLW